MLCRMELIQYASAHIHLPLISHYLKRKSLQLVRHECHAPCKGNLHPTLTDLYRMQRNACDTGCAVSSPRIKSSLKISWRGCSLSIGQRYAAPVDLDNTVMWNVSIVGLRKNRNPTLQEAMATFALRTPGQKCPAWAATLLGLTDTHLSDRKASGGRLLRAVRLDPPPY